MTDITSPTHWTQEFAITQADVDRIAARMEREGCAFDLTDLARRMVCGRLEHGPESSPSAQTDWLDQASIRTWNPAGDWAVGDYAIIWTWSYRNRRYEVVLGEVSDTDADYVYFEVNDTRDSRRKYHRAVSGSEKAMKWQQTVCDAVAKLRQGSSLDERVELVVLQNGERILAELLKSLRTDERFVRLSGRWFLRGRAVPPTDTQLSLLAWSLFGEEEPQSTEALFRRVQPPLPEDDAHLFGLYLALRQHRDLFQNTSTQRPLWKLAGSPPPVTPRHAAYDPDTYHILCVPGELVLLPAARRLWEIGLLAAIL